MVLDGLEAAAKASHPGRIQGIRPKINVIRYADDFIITAQSKELLETVKRRDGFAFDPIEVAPCPDKPGIYRLLDGAHSWSAYKSTGVEEVNAIIKDLDGDDSEDNS